MTVYFVSCKPAVLKLNGEFAGRLDLFERRAEIDLRENILAEVVPEEGLAANFFINERLLLNPPPFLDVYLGECEATVYIRRFEPRDRQICVHLQKRLGANLITVFSLGEVYLSVDGAAMKLTPLPEQFKKVVCEEKSLAGYPVLAFTADRFLLVLSLGGEVIFLNEAASYDFGDKLRVSMDFETCTAARAECEYAYDGQSLTLVSGVTEEIYPADENIMHFAFFESVLTRGDFEKYLSPDMREKAAAIRDYLGGFEGVTVPTETFEMSHPGVKAAGLVYKKAENLFEIKYFAVEIKDGKIDNILPV